MADEPRWIWKKKVLLYCLQLSKLKKDDLISIADDFDLSTSGLKDDLVYNIQHHIQSNLGSPILSKDAIQRMIQKVEPVTPQAVLHEIKSMTQSSRPVIREPPRNNTPVGITGLLSDAIRNKYKSSNSEVNNSRPYVNNNTSIKGSRTNSCEINTNPRHRNVSYSFPEVPFYPRAKLLDDAYISPITNRKLKKTFNLDLTKDQYKGLQDNQYKIYFFCGAIPISIDLDDDEDDDDDNNENKGKHEIIPISFPQTYQFINLRTGEALEKHSMSNKKNQRSKPIDVTDLLSPKQRLGNSPLQFSFHFVPAVEYYMSIYLVNVIKTEDIVNKICQHTKILSNATLYYLKKTQNPDNGLLATSIVISLECPISGSVMKVPVKSTKCLHIECFDAFWYLQSQRQIANGRCPICSKFIKTEDLAVSEFIEDILMKCPNNCRKVQLTNDGHWDPIIESDDEDSDINSDDDDDEAGYGHPPTKKQKPSSPNNNTTPQNYIESVAEVINTNESSNHNSHIAITQNTLPFNILDPDLINVMTPTNNKIKDNISFNSEINSTTASPSTSHIIPNILGSTPLNKNNYKGLPTTKTFHNLAAMSAPLQEDNTRVEKSPSTSLHHTAMSLACTQMNINRNTDHLPQSDNVEFDNNVSMCSTINDEETVLHGNIENIDSTIANTHTNENISCPSIPKLPDLPALPLQFIQEQPHNYNRYSTNMTIKPVVVPFNASLSGTNGNVLPQKRQLSRGQVIIKQPLNK
ncbi:hypothetical protein MOSE0_I04786 [Monosporozyma servazzii]